jgi:hypothetical protein
MGEVIEGGDTHEIIDVGLNVTPNSDIEEEQEEPGYYTENKGQNA